MALVSSLIVRILIIWMMVMKMPSEKRPRVMTFLRRWSLDFRSIGKGVSILVEVSTSLVMWWRGENGHDDVENYGERGHGCVHRNCN